MTLNLIPYSPPYYSSGSFFTAAIVAALLMVPTTITIGMRAVILMVSETKSATTTANNINSMAAIINNAFFLFIFFSFWGAFLGQALGFAKGLSDDPLQLTIGAAELVRSPCLYRIHRISVDTQNKTLCLSLCHRLMIQCTCVHYWLSSIVTTQNYKQVANHGSLLIVVEVDNLFA